MSVQATRLELFIDVFDQPKQRALALPTITRNELVASILQEFREFDFLSDNPAQYQLLKADDNSPLLDEKPVGEQQVTKGQHLRFAEQELPLPEGTTRPSLPIYLRDLGSGKVYKLHWLPAIVGRPDPDADATDNAQLAVDLESEQTGLRVSRRHASITEENGQFYVASLSQNSTSIQDSDGNTATIGRRWRLQNGNVIHLDRSGISFKFIVRQPVVAAADTVEVEETEETEGQGDKVTG